MDHHKQKFSLPLTLLALALIALLLNSAIPHYAFSRIRDVYEVNLQARADIELIDAVLMSGIDMQSGMHGYVITDDPVFLKPYYNARSSLGLQLERLRRSMREDRQKMQLFEALKARVLHARDFYDQVISTRQNRSVEEARAMVMGGEGQRRIDAVRAATQELQTLEQGASTEAVRVSARIVDNSNKALLVITLVDVLLFMLAFIVLFRTLRSSEKTRRLLNTLHAESMRNSELLQERNQVQSLQSRLVDLLQAAVNPEEAYAAIEKFCGQLFPHNPGIFYIRNNSRDYFEPKAYWGGVQGKGGFEPPQCWAARSNHPYRCDSIGQGLACGHVAAGSPAAEAYLCIPIASSDEMIGSLTLMGESGDDGKLQPVSDKVEALALEIVKQIGISIANLRLRNSLRNSSIIDALTGLYNRRYLDETLGREIARAERLGQTVGLIMMDVDHFKAFNDNYGHEMGDQVLIRVAATLKNISRASDLACRFGGEELILVMPIADRQATLARAETIRQAIKGIEITYNGQSLPPVTASFGVAVYPKDGTEVESILRAADTALYRAKENGRDRVESFVTTEPQAVPALK